MTDGIQRRLAAILAADVAGYSRLMGEDEAGTLSALRHLRTEIFAPTVDGHRGKVVKSMGDGWLVEFASVVDAVTCAIEVQEGLAGHESIKLRVGVHLGDITHEDEDIFGDGVNIAARLQEIAEPGGIVISDIARRSIDDKLAAPFVDLGVQALKNIAKPITVYGWGMTAIAAETATLALLDKPSIAVLPFTNMSGDPEQEYFADGITEDIINALARCRWLRVVARNSTFAYKGQSIDVRRISDELGVRYILQGSVRKSKNRIRVTAQVIDGRDGTQLWGERYDRDLDDIFALQDEIAAVIVGTIGPELEMLEGAMLSGRPTVDLNAWDCYQRGLWHLYHFKLEELDTARELFERAIALDANFAQAYARLAYVHIQLGWYGPRESKVKRLNDAISLAKEAVELDGRDPAARLSLGRALTLSGAIEHGIEELRIAIELDPSFAQGHFALAQALCYCDQHKEALPEINEALRLSPRDPHRWTFLNVRALARYQAENLEQAAADEGAALRQPNATHWPVMVLAAVLGRQGKRAEAEEAVAELDRLRPGMTCADARLEWYFGDHPFMTQRFIDQFVDDIRKAGLPD